MNDVERAVMLDEIGIIKDYFREEIREMRKSYCMKKFGVNYPEEKLHCDPSTGLYSNEDAVDLMRRDVDLYEAENLCNLEGIIDHSIPKTAKFIRLAQQMSWKLASEIELKRAASSKCYDALKDFLKVFDESQKLSEGG